MKLSEEDLKKIELISRTLFELLQIFEDKIALRTVEDRYIARARSMYFQYLSNSCFLANQLKQNKMFNQTEMFEFKNKFYAMSRMQDETGGMRTEEEHLTEQIQNNLIDLLKNWN